MGTLALTRALRAAISLITMTLTAGVLVVVAPTVPAQAADPAPPCFTKAADEGEPYPVPTGVARVRITAYGEAGQRGMSAIGPGRDAGAGSKVVADVAVSPGDVLRPIRINGGAAGQGGDQYNGQASGGNNFGFAGTHGGAARGVVRVTSSCREPLVVAGAGGGNGSSGSSSISISRLSPGNASGLSSTGGAAGLGPGQPADAGQAGKNDRNNQEDGAGGGGGTLTAGGAGGAGGRDSLSFCANGIAGGGGGFESAGGGANGQRQDDCDARSAGGGGGGGYYGGGGGGSHQDDGSGSGAGGGGSSYVVAGATNVSYAATNATQPPAVSIEPIYVPAGAPATVTARTNNTRADVSFTPPTAPYAIASYTVTSLPGGHTVSVAPGTGVLSGTVTGLTNGTPYRFTVTAVPAAGVLINGSPAVSPQSNQVTPAPQVSSAVRNFTATPGDGTAQLSWDAPADNGGASIIDYTISWPSGSGHRAQTVTGTSVTINQGLTNGQVKQFRIVARNSVGDGPEAFASTTPRAVAVPVKQPTPTGIAGNGAVDLRFTPAQPGYDEFVVTISPAPNYGGATQTFDAEYGYGNPTGVRINFLTNGTPYRFTVAARNDKGVGPASDLSDPITPRLTTPVALGATVQRGLNSLQVDLDYVIDGGSPVTSVSAYAVRWGGAATPTVTVPLETPGVLPDHLTIPGITTGELHQVFVSAANAQGAMAFQSAGYGRAHVTPGQPTDVEVSVPNTRDGGTVDVTFLTWQTGDCGDYEITAHPGGLTRTGAIGGSECNGLQLHDVEFDGLDDDTTYTFTVQVAVPVAGAGPASDPSDPVRPYVTAEPNPVTDLVASPAGSGKVRLTFTPPAGGSWKYPVTSYRVSWDHGFLDVPAAQANGGTVLVDSLENGRQQTFRVTAVNQVGQSTVALADPVTPRALGKPTGLVAEGADETARLSFDGVENNGGGDLEYVVSLLYQGSVVDEVVTDSSPVLLTDLDNNRSYDVTVRSRNADGEGAESDSISLQPVSGLPRPPTNVAATSTQPERATITWTAPEVGAFAPRIVGYTVTAHPGGRQVEVEQEQYGPVVETATMSGLTNGTAYRFTVHANVDTCPMGRCSGMESDPSNPVTPDRLAQAPITLASTSTTYGSNVSVAPSGGSGAGAFGALTATGDACEIQGTTLVPLHATRGGHTCTVSVTKADDTTYRARTLEQVVTIAPKPLTVTARNQHVVYGDTVPQQVDYGTFVTGDGPGELGGTLTFGGSAVTSPGAGTRALVPGGLTSTDYELQFVAGTVTFDQREARIVVRHAEKVYGEDNPGLGADVTGTLDGEELDYALITPAGKLSTPGTPYPITATLGTNPNYDITVVPAFLAVRPAPLTITADDVSAPFGEQPVFTVTPSGLIGSDTLADFGGTLQYALQVPSGPHPADTFDIWPSGLASSSYDIQWAPGTLTRTARVTHITWATPDPIEYGEQLSPAELDAAPDSPGTLVYTPALGTVLHAGTHQLSVEFVPADPARAQSATKTVSLEVTPAPLTVTTRSETKVYGAANPAFSVDHGGFVNGDGAGDLGGTLAFATTADATSPVGDYGVTPSGLTSSDYAIDFEDGTLSVTKAPLTVTARDASRAYGAANPAFAVDYDGFVNSDDEGDLGGTLAYATTAGSASPAGDYDVTPSGLTSSNYAIDFEDGTLSVTATDSGLTWSAPGDIVYGTALTADHLDATADVPGTFIYTPALGTALHAGTHTLTVEFEPTQDDRYESSSTTVDIEVTQATLVMTAGHFSKVYGEPNPVFTVDLDGFVNGDDAGDLGGTLTFMTSAGTSSPVAHYDVIPTGLTSSDYAIDVIRGSLTVRKAPLTVTARDSSRAYGAANPAFAVDVAGFVNGDDAGDLGGTLFYATAADAASPVGDYDVRPYGLVSPDYAIVFEAGTLTVGQAEPGLAWAEPDPITYGDALTATELGATADVPGTFTYTPALDTVLHAGTHELSVAFTPTDADTYQSASTTVDVEVIRAPLAVTTRDASRTYGAANPGFAVDHEGFVNGDDASDLGGTLAFATDAGASSPVGDYGVMPSGLTSSDYAIDFDGGTLSVTKAPLTVTARDSSRAFGAANPVFAVDHDGFVNGEDAGDLGGTVAFATDADVASPVGEYDVTPSGLTSSNYAIDFRPGTLTVTRTGSGLTWGEPAEFVYGTALSGDLLDATADVPGTFTYSPAAGTVLHAGTHELLVTFTPGDADTYRPATTTVEVVVTRAPLTATTQDVSKTYGQANPAFAVDHDGFVNGDDAGDLGGTLGFVTDADATSDVGEYDVTPRGLTSPDYAITFEAGTLTVEKASTTVAWADPDPIEYGTALTAAQLDATAGVPGTFTYSPAAGTVLHAGTHELSVTFVPTDADNHLGSSATVEVEVTRAPLAVTTRDVSKTYGQANPVFAVDHDGFVNGDDAADLGGTLGFVTDADASSDAGEYDVTPRGLTSPDYAITFEAGTLTVEKASTTVAWADPDPIGYGSALTAAQLDATADVPGTFTYTPALGTVLHAGTHELTVDFTPTDAHNHHSSSATVEVEVTRAPLTVTANDATREHGEDNPELDAAYDGFLNGDGPADLGGVLVLDTDADASSAVGDYGITPSGLTSTDYAITYVAGTLTVGRALPTITWEDPAAIGYGTALTAAQLDATADVPGTFTYTPAAGTILGGGTHDLAVSFVPTDADTYRPTTATVRVQVTRAPLTVTVVDSARAYGAANPAFDVTYDGFLPGDGPGSLGGALAFATPAGTGSPTGAYPVTASGLTSPDYAITYVAGSMQVTAATSLLRWDTPAPISYGTALSAAQLGAIASTPGTYTYTPALGAVLHAGTHQLRVSFVPDDSSVGAVTGTVQLRVTKAPLTVTPLDVRRTYGEANPGLEVGYDGFVNGDGPAALGGALRVRTDAVTTSAAGKYPITASGLSSADYDIAYAAGVLTVAKAAVVLTGDPVALPKVVAARRIAFSGSVVSAVTGAPVAGVEVTFTMARTPKGSVSCTATTNARGIAVCRSTPVRKAVLADRVTYAMSSAGTAHVLAGNATGRVTRS